MTATIVELDKLTKYYGKSRGIIDVSFGIGEGEIFGFIGPNGAGKSTTIRTLLNLIHPTSGGSSIFGMDPTKDYAKIAASVGYIPSEIFYYDDMRVGDLLKYSASFYRKDCSARMKELVEMMELDTRKKIRDLSLGNKKKVSIVQGLQHEPRLLILDEPTSGLDPLMQQRFFDLVRSENEKGVTVLFSSHILSEVQKLCHRVGIVKEGRLISLEDMASLREQTTKSVRLELKEAIPPDYFRIDGARDIQVDDHSVSFFFKGDINSLTAKLAPLELADIWIGDPELEDIFMHFYNRED